MPLRTIASGLAEVMSAPSSRTDPPAALRAPAMHINVEDLPAPLAPTSATSSPVATDSEAPRTARIAP